MLEAELASPITLPPSFMLRNQFTKCENQLLRNQCQTFSTLLSGDYCSFDFKIHYYKTL